MKRSIETGNFVVYDDVLSTIDFQSLWQWVQAEEYKPVSSTNWLKVWRISDGMPMGSSGLEDSAAPFNSPMDKVHEALKTIIPHHPAIFGDWNRINFRSYIYPRGTKIDWHNDQGYTAAAILYTHQKWSAHWGGELRVAEVSKNYKYDNVGGQVDTAWKDDFLNEWGVGHYIQPKPNRFVITPAGVWHSINRVDVDAGDNCRCSIVCFFKKV